MKLNNKGFAISTVMYMILIMTIVLITLTLSLLSSRRLILEKQKDEAKSFIYNTQGLLSDEYQRVEYIQNDGYSYIDAEFVPNKSTSIDVVYQTDKTEGYSQYITGSRDADQIAYALSGSKNSNDWVVTLNGDGGKYFNSGGGTRNTNKYRSIFEMDNGSATWTLKDLTNNSIIYTKTEAIGEIQATENMFIFAFNSSSIHEGLKIYSYKAYQNGILIRNFIPCYRKSDSEAGLYDLVGKKFYQNSGTGSFTKGSDI